MNFFQVIIDLLSSFSIVDLYYVFNEDHLYSIFEKSLHLWYNLRCIQTNRCSKFLFLLISVFEECLRRCREFSLDIFRNFSL